MKTEKNKDVNSYSFIVHLLTLYQSQKKKNPRAKAIDLASPLTIDP